MAFFKASWYPNWDMTTILPTSSMKFFRGPEGFPVEVRANFVDEEDAYYGKKNNDFKHRPSETK